MTHLQSMIGWEMGEETNFGAENRALGENRADIKAINEHIQSLARDINLGTLKDADKKIVTLPVERQKQWRVHWDDWRLWYATIEKAWFVTESDVQFARKKRDDINKNVDPASFEHVQKTAHSKEIAKAPEEGDSWWVKYTKYFQWKYVKWWGPPLAIAGVYAVGSVYVIKKGLPLALPMIK